MNTNLIPPYPSQINVGLENGVILIGSDAHIWPGEPSTALRAFIRFCKELEPRIIVLNGDVLDFGSISRHQPKGWFLGPRVHEEIESAQDSLHEMEKAAGPGVRKFWTIGNHEIRFDTKIAANLPHFEQVKGVTLGDHFPNWTHCWSIFVNGGIAVKHRFKGGIHAPHNNAMWAGCTIITGHLHSQKIDPITNYMGTVWGVDTGCLAGTDSSAFYYNENNPKNWRSGFCVATILNSKLLPPEFVTVWEKDSVVFRGEVIKV